jgi:hypothetical protein
MAELNVTQKNNLKGRIAAFKAMDSKDKKTSNSGLAF